MPTDPATARITVLQRAVFEDGLGKRHRGLGHGGEPVELLQLRDEFNTGAFEGALRERVTTLAAFQKTCFVRVHGLQRNKQSPSKLFVVSDHVAGARLSTVLGAARELVPLAVNAKLCLIRELVAAIGLLHEKLPGIAHGAIALERIVITPEARLVVADHVIGSALEQLRYSPEQYWKDLRIALPPGSPPAFDQRADVMQIGIVALELMLGRAIDRDEYPARIEALVGRAFRLTATRLGDAPPVDLQPWLLRMLQLDPNGSFASAVDAWEDLERVLGASRDVASFDALKSFMAEYVRKTPPAPVTATPSEVPPSVPVAVAVPAVAAAATALIQAPEAMPPRPVTLPSPVLSPAVSSHSSPPDSTSAEPNVTLPGTADPAVRPGWRRRAGRGLAAAAALVLLVGAAGFGQLYFAPPAVAESTGTLVVNTTPSGVAVIVDGHPRGVTPLTVELAPGEHVLTLATEGEPRIIPFTLTAGKTVAQTIELPKAAAVTGHLVVHSEPPGARVTIDGTPIGTTPVKVEQLTPGTHSVTLQTDLRSVTQDVTIEPGTTASLVVPMAAPEGVPVSGWISVTAPTEVQVYEDTRLLGTSRSDRIMVQAGRHELSIVNEALGYRATRSVTVSAGNVSAIQLDWPNGSLALNAQPWAEVWVDGNKKGETPIGNISVPVGTHEVVFRHPEFGERVVRATVTATTPSRVTVDMRKP
ncbi:MAG TPA: PEGA domain-containing protein [Vicinamibacterales bacterium]|nr:PEGA domain-containing protein [Vicinamibacterales bacterium]